MDIEAEVFGDAGGAPGAPPDDGLPPEFAAMSADDIARRTRLLDTEVRVLRDEATRLGLEQGNLTERVSLCVESIGHERSMGFACLHTASLNTWGVPDAQPTSSRTGWRSHAVHWT